MAVTGILVGIAAGSALGGWAVEAWGAQRAYLVPVFAGVVAVGVLLARRHRLAAAERDGAGRGILLTPAP